MYTPIKRLSRVNATLQGALAAGSRIFGVLDTHQEMRGGAGRDGAAAVCGRSIEYRDVGFRYADARRRPCCAACRFTARPGEVVAIVGTSGAGKTTLVNLLPRFYDVTEGAVLIDGVDVRQATLASLREQIGLVTQETFLFNDTVRANIAYGLDDVDEARIETAARAALAHDFILDLPRRYDTMIGERGSRLSGGQRQRIAIARAILKDPPILILDEATSALDSQSERLVQEALANLMKGRTTLVIAHRLTTVRDAACILVIDGGEIRETGTHEELLRRPGGVYRRLYELQFRDGGPRAVTVRSMTGFGVGRGRERAPARVRDRAQRQPPLPRPVRAPARGAWPSWSRTCARLVQARVQRGKVEVSVQARFQQDDTAAVSVSRRSSPAGARAARGAGGARPRRRGHGRGRRALPGRVRRARGAPGLGDARGALLGAIDGASRASTACARAEGDGLRAVIAAALDAIECGGGADRRAVARARRARGRVAARAGRASCARSWASRSSGSTRRSCASVERADVAEEVQRLRSHVAQARELLAGDGALRQAARLPGAGADARGEHDRQQVGLGAALVREVVGLKAEVERFREQVQNVE